MNIDQEIKNILKECITEEEYDGIYFTEVKKELLTQKIVELVKKIKENVNNVESCPHY